MAIQTALISVSDKLGLVAFARGLSGRGVRLLSSGGTDQVFVVEVDSDGTAYLRFATPQDPNSTLETNGLVPPTGTAFAAQYRIGNASAGNVGAAVQMRDVADGLAKAEVFGIVVVLVCCNIGLNTRGGPREIGASVTRAVVVSLIMILVLDYFVSKVLIAAS